MNTVEEMIHCLGIVVEIDKLKFAKHKYYRDKRCGDNSWIFRGIERTNAKRFFTIPVMKCNAETLLPIIQAFIYLKSIIISDK